MASFLGGPELMQKDLGQEHTNLLDYYTQLNRFGSKGSKFANQILKGFMKGDMSLISNPFLGQNAANKRLIDSQMDPFLPPELAQSQARVAKARSDEQTGMQFENFLQGMLGHAMDTSQRKQEFKAGLQRDILGQMANNRLDSQQVVNKPGWGGALMQGLFGAAGAASGLGFKPFGS